MRTKANGFSLPSHEKPLLRFDVVRNGTFHHIRSWHFLHLLIVYHHEWLKPPVYIFSGTIVTFPLYLMRSHTDFIIALIKSVYRKF